MDLSKDNNGHKRSAARHGANGVRPAARNGANGSRATRASTDEVAEGESSPAEDPKQSWRSRKPARERKAAVPVSMLLKALRAYKKGDFSARMPLELTGPAGEVSQAFNDVIEQSERFAREIERLNDVVGKQGRLGQRASIGDVRGSWKSAIDLLNGLIDDLAQPTAEVGRVIGSVAAGDLEQTMALESDGRPLRGEFLRTAKVVNGMVEQLGSFASEVTRVAREVGTEGKLGGQAQVKGVAGTWKDLTDNVNLMAGNLTAQVRNIAEVTTAVARGDLSKKITVDVKGEILQLKNTINTMVDQLNAFASEVTRVAREVGTEGKLGGQAQLKGVAGTWKDLTDNGQLHGLEPHRRRCATSPR